MTADSALSAAAADVFRPQDRREIADWARDNIVVGSWSPWPGPFDPSLTPWIIEPLRVLGQNGPRRVTITGPAAGVEIVRALAGPLVLASLPFSAAAAETLDALLEHGAPGFHEEAGPGFCEAIRDVLFALRRLAQVGPGKPQWRVSAVEVEAWRYAASTEAGASKMFTRCGDAYQRFLDRIPNA